MLVGLSTLVLSNNDSYVNDVVQGFVVVMKIVILRCIKAVKFRSVLRNRGSGRHRRLSPFLRRCSAPLKKGKGKAQGIHCMNDHRATELAWKCTPRENGRAGSTPHRQWYSGHREVVNPWDYLPVPGAAYGLDPDQANYAPTYDMIEATLWPYTKSVGITKSAYRSTITTRRESPPRILTMSESLHGRFAHVPTVDKPLTHRGIAFAADTKIYTKMSKLDAPSKLCVFPKAEDAPNGVIYDNMDGSSPPSSL